MGANFVPLKKGTAVIFVPQTPGILLLICKRVRLLRMTNEAYNNTMVTGVENITPLLNFFFCLFLFVFFCFETETDPSSFCYNSFAGLRGSLDRRPTK